VTEDEGGYGLRAFAIPRRVDKQQLFHFAASKFNAANIDSARHPPDLKEDGAIYVRLDTETSGVGTGACGPAVRPEYQVRVGQKRFGFVLMPFSKKEIPGKDN
jgi:beta-galactosidase